MNHSAVPEIFNRHEPSKFSPNLDETLSKALNTAFISTQLSKSTNISADLYFLKNTDAFKSLMVAVSDFSKRTGLSQERSAECLIETIRKLDNLWTEYFIQDGINRLKDKC